ncbi:hypothetical protein KCP76_16735 [Salmonella enterica subsp. enterica serovar Weltevreden]|nr:hypothetical protein KCP76_16735 [Salmonella enterica subsp. enterica serovar Weltevreden]
MGTRGCDGFIRPDDSHLERSGTRPIPVPARQSLIQKIHVNLASEWVVDRSPSAAGDPLSPCLAAGIPGLSIVIDCPFRVMDFLKHSKFRVKISLLKLQ